MGYDARWRKLTRGPSYCLMRLRASGERAPSLSGDSIMLGGDRNTRPSRPMKPGRSYSDINCWSYWNVKHRKMNYEPDPNLNTE